MADGRFPQKRDFNIEKFLEGDTPEIIKQKFRLALDCMGREQLVSFIHQWAGSLPKEQLKSAIYRMLELDEDQGR